MNRLLLLATLAALVGCSSEAAPEQTESYDVSLSDSSDRVCDTYFNAGARCSVSLRGRRVSFDCLGAPDFGTGRMDESGSFSTTPRFDNPLNWRCEFESTDAGMDFYCGSDSRTGTGFESDTLGPYVCAGSLRGRGPLLPGNDDNQVTDLPGDDEETYEGDDTSEGDGDIHWSVDDGAPQDVATDWTALCEYACDAMHGAVWDCISAAEHATCRETCAVAEESAQRTFVTCNELEVTPAWVYSSCQSSACYDTFVQQEAAPSCETGFSGSYYYESAPESDYDCRYVDLDDIRVIQDDCSVRVRMDAYLEGETRSTIEVASGTIGADGLLDSETFQVPLYGYEGVVSPPPTAECELEFHHALNNYNVSVPVIGLSCTVQGLSGSDLLCYGDLFQD